MTKFEIFLLWSFLMSAAQWISFFKIRAWWRNRTPEPKQSRAVDRVLYHEITDTALPWQAGESWQKHGRGYTVALIRQGLGDMLDELEVNDYRAVYCLGYAVKEQEGVKDLDAMRKQLQRRDSTIDRLQAQIEELRTNRPKPKPEPEPVRTPVPTSEWARLCEEWARSPVLMEELRKDSTSTQTEEPTTDYKALKGKEKIETMLRLRAEGKTNAEIAQLFGMSVGGVKGIISKNKPRPDNLVTLDFGVSEEVSEGF